jgi:RNA polymerase sigma factor (sigma-70 family)
MIHHDSSNPISLAALLKYEAYRPLSRDEELALVYQAKAGNRIAKERLFRSASKALVQVARKSGSFAKRSGFDVDDLVSIGYLAFERAIIDYKPILNTPFSGFLYKCAYYKILDAVRKYRTAITLPVSNNLSPSSMLAWKGAAGMISIDEKMETFRFFDIPVMEKHGNESKGDRVKLRRIARAMAKIEPRKKEVFSLYYGIDAKGNVKGPVDSYDELASRLGITCSTIKSNLCLAKKQIRDICRDDAQPKALSSSHESKSDTLRKWHRDHVREHRIRMGQVRYLKSRGWISLGKGKWFKEGTAIKRLNEAWEHENTRRFGISGGAHAIGLEAFETRTRFPRRAQG